MNKMTVICISKSFLQEVKLISNENQSILEVIIFWVQISYKIMTYYWRLK